MNKKKNDKHLILVNPKVVSNTSSLKKFKESCMSLPNYRGNVKRREKLEIEFQDRYGKKDYLKATGFLARVILHEIDHLDGILFVDRMENPNELELLDLEWK